MSAVTFVRLDLGVVQLLQLLRVPASEEVHHAGANQSAGGVRYDVTRCADPRGEQSLVELNRTR